MRWMEREGDLMSGQGVEEGRFEAVSAVMRLPITRLYGRHAYCGTEGLIDQCWQATMIASRNGRTSSSSRIETAEISLNKLTLLHMHGLAPFL